MNSIFSILIEHIVQFAVLLAGVLLIKWIFKKQLSAAMQYLLWGVVILKLLIPLGLPSNLSPLNLFNQEEMPAAEQTAQIEQASDDLSSDIFPADNLYKPSGASEIHTQPAENMVGGSNISKAGFDWTTFILIVWAEGVLIVSVWFALGASRLRKLALNKRKMPEKWMLELFENCVKEMGIRGRIELTLQEYILVPAISGVFKPVLFLPVGVTTGHDKERLRHIFLHELSHYKRGDIIVTYLLNILNALYWFNPLVWMAIKLINKDMETACDTMALRYLGVEKRHSYIETIIVFAGKDGIRRLNPALCMNSAGSGLKKRIKGMFLKKKTKLTIKIPVTALAILMAVMCCTTACQSKPATNFANNVNKIIQISSAANSRADSITPTVSKEDTQMKSGLLTGLGAPETYKDSYTNPKGDVSVNIDAKVEVPPAEDFFSTEVKLASFSQEQADDFAAYFLKGAPVYTEEKIQTQKDIKASLEEYKKQLEEIKAGTDSSDKEELQSEINYLEKQYTTAPEHRKRNAATTQMVKGNDGIPTVDVLADLGKDDAASFKIHLGQFNFSNDGNGEYCDFGELLKGNPRGMKTTPLEAQETILGCLSELKIDNMQMESVNAATYYRDNSDHEDKTYIANAKQCYVFNLVRVVQGIPVTRIDAFSEGMTSDPNVPQPIKPHYNITVPQEYLQIKLDDTGIVGFEWRNPDQQTALLSQKVGLVKFNQNIQTAKDNIFNKRYTAYNSKANIKITSIKLGMMRIMEKDQLMKFMDVPVWDFIGSLELDGKPDLFGEQSFATVNAIDGSFINREWGY